MNKLSEANRSMALSVRANGAVGGFMLVNSHFQTRVHPTVYVSMLTCTCKGFLKSFLRVLFIRSSFWGIVYIRSLLMSGCIGLGSKGGSGVGGDGPLSKHRVVTHSWWNWRLVTPVSGSWSSIRGLMAWRSAVSTKQPRPPAFDEVQGPRRNSQAAHGVCLAPLCFAASFFFF